MKLVFSAPFSSVSALSALTFSSFSLILVQYALFSSVIVSAYFSSSSLHCLNDAVFAGSLISSLFFMLFTAVLKSSISTSHDTRSTMKWCIVMLIRLSFSVLQNTTFTFLSSSLSMLLSPSSVSTDLNEYTSLSSDERISIPLSVNVPLNIS